MFAGQHYFQVFFVLIALSCVPVMLLGKPLQIMKQRRQANVSKSNPKTFQSNPKQINENTTPYTDIIII